VLKRISTFAVVFALIAQSEVVPVFSQSAPVENIVLVYGAWVDGSGWKPVYDILVKDGNKIFVLQDFHEVVNQLCTEIDTLRRAERWGITHSESIVADHG